MVFVNLNGILLYLSFVECVFGGSTDKNLIRGVSSQEQSIYKPIGNGLQKWHCLNDSSIVLDIGQINDDYCDCPDGSDEPGTSACSDRSRFYCVNEGFVSKKIKGTMVNDGICDCCDCSDEYEREPWFRGSVCSNLANEYKAMVDKEVGTFNSGVIELRRLVGKNEGNLVEEEFKEMEGVKGHIAELEGRITDYDKLIRDAEMLYEEKVMNSEAWVAEGIYKVFQDMIKTVSKLTENYEGNFKKKTVEDKINKLMGFKDDKFAMDNFDEHLDEIVYKRNEKFESLFLSRYQYKDKMLESLKYLKEIIDDVAENHNEHHEDAGLDAVISNYHDLLNNRQEFFEESNQIGKSIDDRALELVDLAAEEKLEPSKDMLVEGNLHQAIAKQIALFKDSRLASMNKVFNLTSKNLNISNLLAENLLSISGHPCISKIINNYEYKIFLDPNHSIISQLSVDENKYVILGKFTSAGLDNLAVSRNYLQYLREQYNENDLIAHLTDNDISSTSKSFLAGNLPDAHNGLFLTYDFGDSSYNGLIRSAQVFFFCADKYHLLNVRELRDCSYTFNVAGPIGCNLHFKYEPPAWTASTLD